MTLVSQMIEEGKSEELVPIEYSQYVGGTPCSAYRFASLAAPGVHPLVSFDPNLTLKGDDDFFSSDLSQNRLKEIWGHPAWRDVPVMVLYSGDDQYVPGFVDKPSMLQKWEWSYRSQINESLPTGILFEILSDANHEIADERLFRLCGVLNSC